MRSATLEGLLAGAGAIVTGAARGQAAAEARALAAAGTRVVLGDVLDEPGEQVGGGGGGELTVDGGWMIS